MIIGLSGKKGSGKDTVANIIRFLIQYKRIIKEGYTSDQSMYQEYIDWTYQDDLKYENDWETKQFAHKLKQMVCLLIGCTMEQLEDREFKEKELGEEWWFNHIIPEHGFRTKLIDWDKHLKPQKMTPRLLLQLLGTECGRQILHPNIWVNALMADYKKDIGFKYSNKTVGDIYPNWIVTDCRFPNEVKAIEEVGGVIIRIERLNLILDNHESETSLDNHKFEYRIDNNDSIQQLIQMVESILIKLKII